MIDFFLFDFKKKFHECIAFHKLCVRKFTTHSMYINCTITLEFEISMTPLCIPSIYGRIKFLNHISLMPYAYINIFKMPYFSMWPNYNTKYNPVCYMYVCNSADAHLFQLGFTNYKMVHVPIVVRHRQDKMHIWMSKLSFSFTPTNLNYIRKNHKCFEFFKEKKIHS